MLALRTQELCKRGGVRPGLPAPNRSYGLCGRKATLNLMLALGAQELYDREVDDLGFPPLTEYGCRATLKKKKKEGTISNTALVYPQSGPA